MDIKLEDIITTDGYLSFCIDNDICYVKTDYFYQGVFSWRGKSHPTYITDVCVIGHSDYPVTDIISEKFKLIFCINKESINSNTFGIPLGICNETNESELHQIFGNNSDLIGVMNENIIKSELLYLNFNINTFPSERGFVYNFFSGKNWVKLGKTEQSFVGRKKYLREIKSSKFVLCPRGNGIDTHRIWESLYMGSIPVVRYEEAHQLFTDLPILFINDWNDVTVPFLIEKYNEINSKIWNIEKLKQSYWNNFILKTINDNE